MFQINNLEYKLHYNNFENLKEGVYLLRNLDNYKLKIGITNKLERRLKEIKKSFQFCGTKPSLKIECYIECVHNLELEKFLHEELKEFNYQNEWFCIDNINVVLDKLKNFNYIATRQNVIKKEQNNVKKQKIEDKFICNSNKYYHHRYMITTIDENKEYQFKFKDIYIKNANSSWEACCILENICCKILNRCNIFTAVFMEESYKEINPSSLLLDEFNKFNTNALIKINESDVTSLENYFLNEYNKRLFDIYNNVVDYINNNKINNYENCIYDKNKLELQKQNIKEKLKYINNIITL
ncbi:GIY-YIG nuclease family protein, partial [Clostridium botulinum]|nr:GIY-YIG nuclease family protein [Clostridium botulinum]